MNYVITGEVLHGQGYGGKIGFPTVNVAAAGKTLPKEGVYAGTVTLDGKTYRAGVVVGPGDKVEAHMIGYEGNAYGEEVSIGVGKFLRDFTKFGTEEELIIQIKKDLESC